MAKMKCCQECGAEFEAKRGKLFCSSPCRMKFNNRRRDRGAELYDLMMANRFERDRANGKNLLTLMSSLASAYRDADKTLRNGRFSWADLDEVLNGIPMAFGRNGDKR